MRAKPANANSIHKERLRTHRVGSAAVGAAIGIGVFYAARHNHSVTGCTVSGARQPSLHSWLPNRNQRPRDRYEPHKDDPLEMKWALRRLGDQDGIKEASYLGSIFYVNDLDLSVVRSGRRKGGNPFRDFEARDAAGTPRDVAEADPALERLAQVSREGVLEVLPLLLHEASNPRLSVRRLAAMALYQITTRPDGQTLLSAETATLAVLLFDADNQIFQSEELQVWHSMTCVWMPVQHFVPVLESYLARGDAVSTIGAGVAGLLMKAAPNDAASTNAIVQFMRRKEQTPANRGSLLISVRVTKSRSREIGEEVAAYAIDPDEQTSVQAIETLQAMGKSTILDNQQFLLANCRRYEQDPERAHRSHKGTIGRSVILI